MRMSIRSPHKCCKYNIRKLKYRKFKYRGMVQIYHLYVKVYFEIFICKPNVRDVSNSQLLHVTSCNNATQCFGIYFGTFKSSSALT